MNMNENLSSEIKDHTEENKHVLSFHFSKNGEAKTIHLKKPHIAAACLALAVVVGGASLSIGSYLSVRGENVPSGDEAYTENIARLQEKATELEEKINELENVKNELNDQLRSISADEASANEIYNALSGGLETAAVSAPVTAAVTASSENKVAAITLQLATIDAKLNETALSFTDVAANATEVLAAYNSIPNGMPVEGGILSSNYNPDGIASIDDGRVHMGIDLSTRSQYLPITATAAGTVVEADFHKDYGYYVRLDHGNGFTTLYAHNSENLVSVGDVVKKGAVIATTGSTGQSTGIHCHYEIQLNGIYQDPLLFNN